MLTVGMSVYFEGMVAGGAVLAAFLVGKVVEGRAKRRAMAEVEGLAGKAGVALEERILKTWVGIVARLLAATFLLFTLVIVGAMLWLWLKLGADEERVAVRTVATAIAGLPVAMWLAATTAIATGMGRAAALEVLFPRAMALYKLENVRTVIFEKAPTLTAGKLYLTETLGVRWEEAMGAARNKELSPAGEGALEIAAALQRGSTDAVGKAIVESAGKFSLAAGEVAGREEKADGGLVGRIAGREYVMGPVGLVAGMGVSMVPVEKDLQRLRDDGKVLVALAEKRVEGMRLVGLFAFQDVLRTEARQAVRAMRDRGIRVGVISADTELAARGALQGMAVDFLKTRVAATETAAAVAEIGKLARSTGDRRGVAFVGEGSDDVAADLKIVMGAGSGDVVLMSKGISALPAAMQLSRRTLALVRGNLLLALVYHAVAIPLAMMGMLSPVWAAVGLMVTTLIVVANSLWVGRVKLGEADDTVQRD